MKTILNLSSLWLLAMLSFVFFSCTEDNSIEPTTLEASATAVNFTKAGSEQSLTITTNKDQWVATSPLESSWLTLTQNSNKLNVQAAANTEGVERKGYILINAGDAALKVSVTQSAGDAILTLSAEAVDFSRKGGEQRIDVISNTGFTVEVDDAAAAWLSATHMQGSSYFTVLTTAYSEVDMQTGKIYITAGSTVKEVTVTQKGRAFILLPFVAQNTSIGKIIPFEEERGSVLTQLPDGFFNPDIFYFATDSEDFPQMAYRISKAGNYLTALTATENKDLLTDNRFEPFMTDEGFEKTAPGMYVHNDFPYKINFNEEEDGVTVFASYSPKQDKAYPTFAEIPLKTQSTWVGLDEIEMEGKTIEFVKNAESELGSTPNSGNTTEGRFYWFDPSQSEQTSQSTVARAYWFINTADSPYLGQLEAARSLYSKIELGWWYDKVSAAYYLTQEFSNLLADEGFSYTMTNSSGYDFYGKTNGNVMDMLVFKIVQFSDFMPGTKLIDFQTFKKTATDSSVSILTNKEKLIEFARQMDKRMQQLEKNQPLKRIK